MSPNIWRRLAPGLLLCLAVTGAAVALQSLERRLFGTTPFESLVLAIVVGAALRTCWSPGRAWRPGIAFSAKTLLEIAVVLLGASISARVVVAAGPALLASIAGVVVVSIVCCYAIGRAFGLPHRMATLVACGNSICGNSAIVAIAPVIGACGADVSAAIAFTALCGVGLVLALPASAALLHLGTLQYGAFAGLTVYAVPQVLAAAAPAGAAAVQIGTVVKLARVLMLGPVVVALSMLSTAGERPPVHRLVPGFILGFLALAAARSLGLLPAVVLLPVSHVATVLTVVSMAALGLSTDLGVAVRAGGRVTAVVVLSLATLAALSLGCVRLLAL